MQYVWSRAIAAIALALGLASCATVPKDAPAYTAAPPPPAGQSNLYVYRLGGRPLLYPVTIRLNGVVVGALPERGYMVLPVARGNHSLQASWPLISATGAGNGTITVGDGPAYARILSSSYPIYGTVGGVGFDTHVRATSERVAEAELSSCCRRIKSLDESNVGE